MSQQLVINGKRYLPSTELAREYSYTSDYISRLARDEKVLGTRVGRQWFLEPESLRTYIQQLEVEKRVLKEDLSRQRKAERLGYPVQQEVSISPAFMSIALAFLIMSCGLLSGYVGYVAYQDGVRAADVVNTLERLSQGITSQVELSVAEAVRLAQLRPEPAASPVLSLSDSAPVVRGVGPQLQAGTYTRFPKSPTASTTPMVSAEDISSAIAQLENAFSDDVAVELVDGELLVLPASADVSVEPYRLSEILSGRVNPPTE